ncbi:MRG-domain-containing protein [Phlyctochytrium arcticum]|nr:MRG-domain-containing protein [Phlyctochytrium arcticum]
MPYVMELVANSGLRTVVGSRQAKGSGNYMREKDKRLNYAVDERILCYHGPLLYEAKVLKTDFWENDGDEDSENYGPHYFIHYKGWNVKWDDWVTEARILKWSEENLNKQAELEDTISPTGRKASVRIPEKGKRASNADRRRRRESTLQSPDEADQPQWEDAPAFELPLSDSLKKILVRDRHCVIEKEALMSLPRTPSISDIFDQFLSQSDARKDEISSLVNGLKMYFNSGLKSILLYQQERPQFAQLAKKSPDVNPCNVYGAEHILRLFVRLPTLVSRVGADQSTLAMMKEHFQSILTFIDKNQEAFFTADYQKSNF